MKKLLPIGLVLATAFTGIQAHAASATWNSTGTDGNWFTPGNWSTSAVPGSAGTGTINNADTATFNSASNNTTIAINGTALNIKGITFDTSAAAYTIGTTANSGNSILLSSGGAIQITSGLTGTGEVQTINAPLILEGATATTAGTYSFLNANTTASNVLAINGNLTAGTTATVTLTVGGVNTGTNTISGNISGNIAVSKASGAGNSGDWILSGNNSYTGSTTVNAGTLILSGSNSTTNTVAVGGSSTLDINNAHALGSGTLTLSNAAILDNTSGSAITLTTNNAITSAGSMTFGGSNSLNLGTGNLTMTSRGTWTISSNTLTIGGNITATTGTITKAGNGTLAISGNNTSYAPGFVLSGGTLAINGANALGTGTLTINAGTGTVTTIDNTTGGAITNSGNNVQIWNTSFTYGGTQALDLGTGSVTIGASNASLTTVTVTTTANNLTVGGAIGTFNASNQLVKAGAGTLTLTGASTFTGTTTVTGGVLALGNTAALSSPIVLNGGNLDLATDTAMSTSNVISVLANSTVSSDRATAGAGLTQGLGALNIGGFTLTTTAGANVTSGTPVVSFGATTFTSTLTQTSTFNPTTAAVTLASVTSNANSGITDTLVLDGTASGNSVTGAIGNGVHGTMAVVKSNSSSWTLGGANTYTGGTTVSGGNLVLTGSTSATGTFTVGGVSGGLSTATLSGTGTLSGLLVTSAANSNVAHIAPGATAGTVGTLHVGTVGFTIGAGTQFDFDINTSTSTDDLIAMTGGTLTIGGTGIVFNFDQLSSLTAGTAYTLISGATSVSGFSASDFSATGDTGYTATFNNTGTAITVTFTATGGGSNNYYYTGATSNDFTVAGNYNTLASGGTAQSTALSSTSDVFLNATSPSPTNTATLSGSASVNSLNFVTAGTSLAGSGTVTLAATGTAGITDSAGVAGQTETVSPSVILGSNQSWAATANSTLNVAGNVSGAQSLALTGNGTFKLGGANTFQGLTVGTGTDTPTLYLTNGSSGSATGTTTLRVNAGATLAGNGTSSGTSFNISGTGTATGARANVLVGLTSLADTTTTNVLTLKGSSSSTIADANLTFNLDAKSTASTQLSVGNTAIAFGTDAGSVVFTLNLQNEPAIVGANTLYTLIAGTSSTNQYTGLTLGNSTTVGGVTETIITGNNLQLAFGSALDQSYYGNGSYLVLYQSAGVDDIDVVVVPEPGTWAMMLGGLALLVFVQRARRKNS